MFKDYYEILEIPTNATFDTVKKAFKRQAIKWHPDKNTGLDTTSKMQDINEAYLILMDNEARHLYDKEYILIKSFISIVDSKDEFENDETIINSKKYRNYDFEDDTLRNWVNNARKQSVDLAEETIKNIRLLFNKGLKASVNEIGIWIISYLVIGLFFTFIFLIVRGCS